ncbi:MAG: DUF364 domain-containing protein [Chloroflexota bacterium]|jgi:uncharacterized protein (DUF4213/DUF364 family)
MKILDALLALLPAQPAPVHELIVGIHWTTVVSHRCGMAASLRGEGEYGSQRIRDVGRLHQKSAQELAGWVTSDNPLEASIGLAAINSLLPEVHAQFNGINAFDILKQRGQGKMIVIVGHFPHVDKLRQSGIRMLVLEKKPRGDDLPAEAAPQVVPLADILAITSTTLINHTLEDLLTLRRPGSVVMLIGPSTPLTPLLFDYGIDMLSGTRVVDEKAALLTIRQGAAFSQIGGTRLVTLSRSRDPL